MEPDMTVITKWANEIAEQWIIPRLGGRKLQIIWELSHTRRSFGDCCRTVRTETEVVARIRLSRPLILTNNVEEVRFMVCHELAHIIHMNHGGEFASLVTQMSGRYVPPERARFHVGEAEDPAGGFTYKCPVCGNETKYYKRLFKPRSCGECRPGVFDPRFVMLEVPREEQRERIVVPLTEEVSLAEELEVAAPQFMTSVTSEPVIDPLRQFAATRPRGVTYRCQVCGNEVTYSRRLKHTHSCGRCAPGRYDPRFIMVMLPREGVVRKELISSTPLLNPAVIEHYIVGDTSGWIL